jgi:hypothetical protein
VLIHPSHHGGFTQAEVDRHQGKSGSPHAGGLQETLWHPPPFTARRSVDIPLLFERACKQNQERLLAARAAVYKRLIVIDELRAQSEQYPHMDNEALVISLVATLYLADCESLYAKIRQSPTAEALQIARQSAH